MSPKTTTKAGGVFVLFGGETNQTIGTVRGLIRSLGSRPRYGLNQSLKSEQISQSKARLEEEGIFYYSGQNLNIKQRQNDWKDPNQEGCTKEDRWQKKEIRLLRCLHLQSPQE